MNYIEAVTELESIIGKSATNLQMHIKHMSTRNAAEYLILQAPGLSTEAMEQLLTRTIKATVEINKSKFYATAWCMGATWGQLAAMFGVTRATVHASAKNHLTAEARASMLIERSKFTNNITHHELGVIRSIYEEISVSDPIVIMQARPMTIATMILKIMRERDTSDVDANSPYDAVLSSKVAPDEPKPPTDEPEPIEHIVTKASDMTAFDQMFGKK